MSSNPSKVNSPSPKLTLPLHCQCACAACGFIAHMVQLGQNQRMLASLVVPNQEAFNELDFIKYAFCLSCTTCAYILYSILSGAGQHITQAISDLARHGP